jgi:hypothetical protein
MKKVEWRVWGFGLRCIWEGGGVEGERVRQRGGVAALI